MGLAELDQSVYSLSVTKPTGKEQLVQVGLERFLTDGYAATGINTILDQAGVPKGSFYHHFESKEAFAVEVVRAYAEAERVRFVEFASAAKGSPLERLRKYFKTMIAVHGQSAAVSGCLLGSVSLEAAEHSEALRSAARVGFDGWQAGIAELLGAAIAAGELPKSADADELAALIVDHWEGAHVRAKAEQSDRPLELFQRFTFGTLLKA